MFYLSFLFCFNFNDNSNNFLFVFWEGNVYLLQILSKFIENVLWKAELNLIKEIRISWPDTDYSSLF